MAKKIDVQVRMCENCSLPIARRKRRGDWLLVPSVYARMRFCGRKCASEARRKPTSWRACRACGTPLRRRRWANGELETPSNFRRRQCCDVQCAEMFASNSGDYRSRSLLRAVAKRCSATSRTEAGPIGVRGWRE